MRARAALAHFDAAHTLRRVLRAWQTNARHMCQLSETLTRVGTRLALADWAAAVDTINRQVGRSSP